MTSRDEILEDCIEYADNVYDNAEGIGVSGETYITATTDSMVDRTGHSAEQIGQVLGLHKGEQIDGYEISCVAPGVWKFTVV